MNILKVNILPLLYNDLELVHVLFQVNLSEAMTLALVGPGHPSAWVGGVGKQEESMWRLEILRIECKDKGTSNNPSCCWKQIAFCRKAAIVLRRDFLNSLVSP